jgi:flagellar biosynthetic protein FliR
MLDSATLYLLSGKFVIGILIFIRISGMMASGPFFKSDAIPSSVKVMLSVLLSVITTSAFWLEQPPIDLHLWVMVLVVFKEFFVGLIFGFAANFVFYGARMAGGLIDTDMGYQTAAMFDPSSSSPTLLGEINELIILMLFLIMNGHHYLIEGIFMSVKAIPLTTMSVSNSTMEILIKGASSVLIIGVKMASPLIVSLFITNLILVLLARVAPQTNIFQLSFQFKTAVGLIMLFFAVPLMIMVSKFYLGELQDQIYKILLTLNPGNV